MAQWQILNSSGVPTGDIFDDGDQSNVGEGSFSTTAVRVHCEVRGTGFGFNCMGRSPAHVETPPEPTPEPPSIDPNLVLARLEAELLAVIDPASFAKAQAIAAAQAEYDNAAALGFETVTAKASELLAAKLARIEAEYTSPSQATEGGE